VRLFVLFNDPAYLPPRDAASWIEAEAGVLVGRLSGVAGAHLTALEATGKYAHDHDWLLELRLHPDRQLDGVLDAPALREFVGDLRLLGAQPTVVVARDPIALTGPT